MDPELLHHLGNAWDNWWWLMFPAYAIIGSSVWGASDSKRKRKEEREERRDRRRHDRQDSAEGENRRRQRAVDQAQRVLDEHDSINTRWLEYELDVGKLIDYPMMSDVREPLTVDFLRAKRTADGLRPDDDSPAKSLVEDDAVDEYRRSVQQFGVAFDVAEREAHRVRDSHFSDSERSRLANARKLVNIAEDQAASPNERQIASTRARRELDGIIVLPREAVAELERRTVLGLPASPSSRDAAATRVEGSASGPGAVTRNAGTASSSDSGSASSSETD